MHLLYISRFSHSPPISLPPLTIQLTGRLSCQHLLWDQDHLQTKKKKLPSEQVIAKYSLVTAFNS